MHYRSNNLRTICAEARASLDFRAGLARKTGLFVRTLPEPGSLLAAFRFYEQAARE